MNQELSDTLFNRFPLIFKPDNLIFGFECDNGWFHLIQNLAAFLQFESNHNSMPQIEAVQIKEKYAALNFQFVGGNDVGIGAIRFAEFYSVYICELCGNSSAGICGQSPDNQIRRFKTLCCNCFSQLKTS
jgi:hypothetical protein